MMPPRDETITEIEKITTLGPPRRKPPPPLFLGQPKADWNVPDIVRVEVEVTAPRARESVIHGLRCRGATYRKIGEHFGISIERARQLVLRVKVFIEDKQDWMESGGYEPLTYIEEEEGT